MKQENTRKRRRRKKKKKTPQQKLRTVTKREKRRLGAKGAANTKTFWQKQKFGAASEVRVIYSREEAEGEPDVRVLMGERME